MDGSLFKFWGYRQVDIRRVFIGCKADLPPSLTRLFFDVFAHNGMEMSQHQESRTPTHLSWLNVTPQQYLNITCIVFSLLRGGWKIMRTDVAPELLLPLEAHNKTVCPLPKNHSPWCHDSPKVGCKRPECGQWPNFWEIPTLPWNSRNIPPGHPLMKWLSPREPKTPCPGAAPTSWDGPHSAYRVCIPLNELDFSFLRLALEFFPARTQGSSPGGPS